MPDYIGACIYLTFIYYFTRGCLMLMISDENSNTYINFNVLYNIISIVCVLCFYRRACINAVSVSTA